MKGIPRISEWSDTKVEDTIRRIMFSDIFERHTLTNADKKPCDVVSFEYMLADAIVGSSDDIPVDIAKSREHLMKYPTFGRKRKPKRRNVRPTGYYIVENTLHKVIDVDMMLSKIYDKIGYPKRRSYAIQY